MLVFFKNRSFFYVFLLGSWRFELHQMLVLSCFITYSTWLFFLVFSLFLFVMKIYHQLFFCFQAPKWPLKLLSNRSRKKLLGSSKSWKNPEKNTGRIRLKMKYQVELQVFSNTFWRILSNFSLFNTSKKNIFCG